MFTSGDCNTDRNSLGYENGEGYDTVGLKQGSSSNRDSLGMRG